ncbi:putative nuclear migration protein [Eutypa lata UCREL1]|uniref:Putative nuclear migration protein n=1 Tax=Eutypa lata (strain UCR-EL1) TaxID=1287681 RepID=M7SLA4_EUTLA|nr:putative nuclear migration protein [Eutypa lata UCREL1]
MMAVWETEDELCGPAAASLPTPSDTPYRTPSRGSRKSRRSVTPPALSSSPPPLPPGYKNERSGKRSSRDVMADEPLSILDPRRFTPTLHANLVSEILTLRRDQEEKNKIIESLEETLHDTREEQETLQTNLTSTTKESRSLKRQLALLEGGTSSALGELARERDEAVDVLSETRKRLETTQKKVKTQEEDSQRVHDLWAKEKDDWEEERRKYERKVHVAESRLKTVLDEVAAFQAAQANGAHNGAESEEEDAGKENDGASVRTMSMTNSVRYSTAFAAGLNKVNGHSLADELNFDDDSDSQTDLDGRQSVISSRHNRNLSRDSVLSRTHGRNVSIDSQMRPGSVALRRTLYMNPGVLDRLEGGISEDDEDEEIPVKVEYTDTGVQYSPPPSPKRAPSKPSTPEPAARSEKSMDVESPQRGENEIEANQRRKRVQLNKPIAIEPPAITKTMVFTDDLNVSPPASPISQIVDTTETHDAYPGNNDDGPLSDEKAPTALSAPKPKDGSKKRPTIRISPEQVRMVKNHPASVAKQMGGPEVYSSFSLVEGKSTGKAPTRAAEKPVAANSKSPANAMRKAAMIQSGIASHQTRSPSPSLLEKHDPPFPIPTRASSRRPPASPQYPGTQDTNVGGLAVRHLHYHPQKKPQIVLVSHLSRTTKSLPRVAEIMVRLDTGVTGSTGSSQQASGVVDAIAQTMVGEWMFKYVRRRKSFGVTDGNAEENSNDRHKRWVWLAPYERAILWSSKQPQSGSALMGKSGRKLTIQSVLDVKDDNAPPKGASQIFNRSILILTPQRALKFTATTAERHYLWLTALSFLAHSHQAIPEILPLSPAPAPKSASAVAPPPAEYVDVPRHKTKRGGIRDSIRLTKGKHPGLSSHAHAGYGGGSNGVLPEGEEVDATVNASQLDDALATFKPEAFAPVPIHYRDLSRDAAEPPFIPRFHDRTGDRSGGVTERANQVVLHGRKRSNTGGHVPPPLSFRGFSSPPPSGPSLNSSSSHHAPSNSTAGNSVAGNSIGTAGSSDIYSYIAPPSQVSGSVAGGTTASVAAGWGPVGSSIAGSVRTSEASSRPPTNNFFEAIGTVRMEAFISPLTFPKFDDHPDEADEWRYRARRRSKERRRTRSRSRRRDSYASRGTRATATTATDYSSAYGGGGGRSSRAGTAADEDFFREDPFKGF